MTLRIAICIVGQLRTAHLTAENYKKFIGEYWNQCDFFVHTWAENTPAPGFEIGPSSDSADYPRPLSTNHLKSFIDFYNPKRILIDRFKNYKELPDLTTWMPVYYSIQQSIQLKNEYEHMHKFYYDYVVVLRPDLSIDTDSFKLHDMISRIGQRSFCFVDMHGVGDDQVDTTIWACTNPTITTLMSFHDAYQKYPSPKPDDQQFLSRFLKSRKNPIVPMGHGHTWIYRNHHKYDWDIPPDRPMECKNIDTDTAIKEKLL